MGGCCGAEEKPRQQRPHGPGRPPAQRGALRARDPTPHPQPELCSPVPGPSQPPPGEPADSPNHGEPNGGPSAAREPFADADSAALQLPAARSGSPQAQPGENPDSPGCQKRVGTGGLKHGLRRDPPSAGSAQLPPRPRSDTASDGGVSAGDEGSMRSVRFAFDGVSLQGSRRDTMGSSSLGYPAGGHTTFFDGYWLPVFRNGQTGRNWTINCPQITYDTDVRYKISNVHWGDRRLALCLRMYKGKGAPVEEYHILLVPEGKGATPDLLKGVQLLMRGGQRRATVHFTMRRVDLLADLPESVARVDSLVSQPKNGSAADTPPPVHSFNSGEPRVATGVQFDMQEDSPRSQPGK
eukprot:TRINITY_DN70214_c0_g1_i1.p1 TRINITY_DN70214_c0_g1~~TRINITY_DN70214_c0_g1_i1.p1  ORF type:complete len:394 (+),score=82.99 TRINITY_DN70214_c0_g1_i1:125-1183(+)